MNIVFMGTSEFAVPSLEKLIDSKHKILAVYTKEAKKAGRGYKIQNTPIYNLAFKNKLKIFTPKSLKNLEEQEKIRKLKPDIIIVVAYGLILPKEILDIPKYGCINIHPSLLPRWRGASPIQRALLAGDKETGVCIMKVGEGLDDGDIVKCEKMEILEEADIKYLYYCLSLLGSNMLITALYKIKIDGRVKARKQKKTGITYAEKIEKSEGEIDWTKSADEIDRQIRALWVFPGVYFDYKGERIKILKAEKVKGNFGKAGKVIDDKFTISCGKGAIRPLVLQRAGKRSMKVEEFLRGFKKL